jgi:hypothetical protein
MDSAEMFHVGDLMIVGYCGACQHRKIKNPPHQFGDVLRKPLPEPCRSCMEDPVRKAFWRQRFDVVPYVFVIKDWLEKLMSIAG